MARSLASVDKSVQRRRAGLISTGVDRCLRYRRSNDSRTTRPHVARRMGSVSRSVDESRLIHRANGAATFAEKSRLGGMYPEVVTGPGADNDASAGGSRQRREQPSGEAGAATRGGPPHSQVAQCRTWSLIPSKAAGSAALPTSERSSYASPQTVWAPAISSRSGPSAATIREPRPGRDGIAGQ